MAKALSILVLRFSSIGDIVLTTPLLRCLKKQKPEATIHYATKKQFVSLLSNNPYVDKIHSLDSSDQQLIAALKKETFDTIIDLHNNLRTSRIKKALKVPSKSFYKANIPKWLMVNFKINKLPKEHIVDRYLQTASSLDIVNDHQGLDFFIDESVLNEATNLLNTKKVSDPFVSFAIGGQHNTKRLTQEKIIDICKKITVPIVLLGGPEDQKIGQQIKEKAGQHVVNLCGSCSIQASSAIASLSNVLISHDTGMMHIGAALKMPVLSIWGSTIPEFGMYPYYPKGAVKGKIFSLTTLSCRPCSKLGFVDCPKGHFDCMNQQNTQEIANVALSYFN